MFSWIRRQTASFWLLLLLVFGQAFETFVRPIISLNIEKWAESKGIDNELVDGGRETMTFLDRLIVDAAWLAGHLLDALASQWFFGFVAGSLVFAFWDTLPKFLSMFRSKRDAPESVEKIIPHNGIAPVSLGEVVGLQKSDRTDFDLIPGRLIVRGTLSDDGIDLVALVQFRNRSTKPVHIKPIETAFFIDGKRPDGKMSMGVSTPLRGEQTETLRFGSIRVYDEKDHSGEVKFTVKFGTSRETMRCSLSMHYKFKILSYPPNKSTDAVLDLELNETIEYFVDTDPERPGSVPVPMIIEKEKV